MYQEIITIWDSLNNRELAGLTWILIILIIIMSNALATLPEQSIMPLGDVPDDAPPLPSNLDSISRYDLFKEKYFLLT